MVGPECVFTMALRRFHRYDDPRKRFLVNHLCRFSSIIFRRPRGPPDGRERGRRSERKRERERDRAIGQWRHAVLFR